MVVFACVLVGTTAFARIAESGLDARESRARQAASRVRVEPSRVAIGDLSDLRAAFGDWLVEVDGVGADGATVHLEISYLLREREVIFELGQDGRLRPV